MRHSIKQLKNVLNFALMIIITIQPLTVVYTDALLIIFIMWLHNNVKELLKLALILSTNIMTRTQVSVCLVHKAILTIRTQIFVKREQLHVHQDNIMMTQLVCVDTVNLDKIITT